MLTVRRALQIGGLAKAHCVAGEKGLDRVIKFVDIMEVPDAAGWIRPNEILITCAYSIKDDPAAQVDLVRSLSRCNASALALKPCRFLGPMPRAMIDAADEEGLPLIEIPAGLSYIEITHPLLSEILNDQVQELQYEADVHRKMTRLVLDQKGLESVASTLSGILGTGVYIMDDGFQVLAKSFAGGRADDPSSHAGDQSITALARCIVTRAPDQGVLEKNGIVSGRGISCSPISSGANRLGYVVMDMVRKDPLTPLETRAIEQATIASGLEIAKINAIRETQARLRSDFFARVLSGQEEAQAVTMAKILGINMECLFSVVVASIDGAQDPQAKEQYQRLAAAAREECRSRGFQGNALEFHGSVVAICGESAEKADWNAVSVARAIGGVVVDGDCRTISIGVSGSHKGVSSLVPAYAQARKALDLGRIIYGRGRVSLYRELSPYLLLDNVSKQTLSDYWRVQMGPLIRGNPKLLETLRVFLECGGEIKRASKRLYVHRNTLDYRLERIGDLLGSNVRDPEVQFRLRLALVAGVFAGESGAGVD